MNQPLRIRGGLRLPRDKPGLDRPIVDLPMPEQLLHPLLGHGSSRLEPRVAPGERVRRGTLLADGLRAAAAGTVRAIEARPVLHRWQRTAPCVVIDTGQATRTAPVHPSTSPDPGSAFDTLLAAAVDGHGGAGFPAARKLGAVREHGCRLLLINACECEPGIACDEALLHSDAAGVVDAVGRLIDVLDPTHVCIAIEHDKRTAVAALSQALSVSARIELLLFEPIYPSGAQAPLLACTLAHLGLPDAPTRCSPAEAGLLCLNVATAYALGRTLQGDTVSSRIVTLGSADGRSDANVRVTLGTPIGWLLNCLGHALAPTTRIRIGGPLSGYETTALEAPVTATTHAIHLCQPRASAGTPPPTRPCIRCGECAPVCPVGLQPQLLHWHANADEAPALRRLGIDRCIECGCCDAVCPSALPLTQGFRTARAAQREQAARGRDAERADALVRRRTERLQREQRRHAEVAPVVGRPNVDAALARVKARAARAKKPAPDGHEQ